MMGIKVNGEFLDLFPDSRLRVTLKNPIFADDQIIPGSYSMPLEIPFGPASPKNTRILQNIHVIENVARLKEVEAYHFYDGLKFKKGTLIIGPVNRQANTVSVNFKFGLSTLENIKSKKLSEIVNDTILLNNNTTYVKEVRLDPELASPYHIIVNGKPYEEATIAALVDAINDDTSEPRAIATSGGTYLTVKPFTDQLNIETPFTIDCEDPREWTVTPNDAVWNQPILDALQAYLVEPYPSDKFRLPTFLNPGQFETGYQYFDTGLINMSENGTFKENVSAPEGDGIVNFNPFVSHVFTSIAPYVMLKHVLDEIANHYGFIYEGDFYTQDFVSKALIYTPNSLTMKVPLMGQYPFFFFRQVFNLGEFVPDMSVGEFFKALQSKFCLSVYYKESAKRLVLRFRKEVLKDKTYRDITSKCSPVLSLEDVGLKGMRLQIDADKDDAYCPIDELSIGSEQEVSITSKCFGVSEKQDLAHTLSDVPATNQLFTDKPYPYLRLFFYEGLQNAGAFSGFEFPKASALMPDGNSLNFQDHVYDEWWTEFVAFIMRRKKIDVSSQLSYAFLVSLDFEQKVMFDRVKYLFDQIDFSFSVNPNEPATAQTSIYKT